MSKQAEQILRTLVHFFMNLALAIFLIAMLFFLIQGFLVTWFGGCI